MVDRRFDLPMTFNGNINSVQILVSSHYLVGVVGGAARNPVLKIFWHLKILVK
jgi:hypothetical protein